MTSVLIIEFSTNNPAFGAGNYRVVVDPGCHYSITCMKERLDSDGFKIWEISAEHQKYDFSRMLGHALVEVAMNDLDIVTKHDTHLHLGEIE